MTFLFQINFTFIWNLYSIFLYFLIIRKISEVKDYFVKNIKPYYSHCFNQMYYLYRIFLTIFLDLSFFFKHYYNPIVYFAFFQLTLIIKVFCFHMDFIIIQL